MFGVIMPLCNRMFCCIFGWYFYIEIRLKYEKNILLSSSRAFSLSTHTFSLSTPVDNSEATWIKLQNATKDSQSILNWFWHMTCLMRIRGVILFVIMYIIIDCTYVHTWYIHMCMYYWFSTYPAYMYWFSL